MKKFIIISLLIAIPSIGFAEDRLIIKDDSGATRFKIEDTGAMEADGSDANNAFAFKVLGHTGGTTHTQIITDKTNSRLTVMASTASDFAPRLHMVGPEDASSTKGAAIFDFGSNAVDLPAAQFRVRHYLSGNNWVDMFQIFGRDAVVFPKNDVVVGIRTDNPQHPLQVTTGGAYCNGRQWVDTSSRESKENIVELSRKEAFETLRNIKAVKFNYKKDAAKETNVGFIAEDVPALVATQGRKGLVSMEMVAILAKVVQEQQELIASQQKAFDEQKLIIAELAQRIKQLEAK